VVLCLLVVAAALFACHARVEAGLIDDFAYARTAWAFAQTGHLHYYGWSAVMLSVQTLWAAPFIKLFGPTYFACRLSSQALLLLSLWLLHSQLRRCGVGRALAAFGTLVMGLSPLTIALGVTFMSDVCSLFLMLLCLECAFRIVAARNTQSALGWLLFGFVVSIIGGTERQTVWLGGLVLYPCAAWLVRSRRAIVIATALMWPATIAAALWCTRWYARQPYSETPQSAAGKLTLDVARRIFHTDCAAVFCVLLLVLPLAGLSFPAALRIRVRALLGALVGGVVLAAVMHRTTAHVESGGLFPWLVGVFPSIMPGANPDQGPIFGPHGRELLTYLQGILVALYGYMLWSTRRQHLPAAGRQAGLSWKTMAVLCVPFLGAYAAVLSLRASWSPLFDRYLLPIVAVALLFLLRYTQEHLTQRVSPIAWAILVAFCYWGVAGTHDWIAATKAHVRGLTELMQAGVPRTEVQASFELDADYEIATHGSVTNVDALLFYSPPIPPDKFLPGCSLYHPYTSDIEARFYVKGERIGLEQPTSFPDMEYRAWMPPFRRRLLIAECKQIFSPAPVTEKEQALHPAVAPDR
jgi:hypothetical protein